MSDDINVEEERMKMCFIDFTTEETDGINVKRSSSSVRGENLDDCLKYTKMLHNEEKVKPMNKDITGNEYTFRTPDDWGTITGALVPGANGKVGYAKVDPESGKFEIVVEEPVIKRVQFTAYDRHMRPEIDNDEYLEHELVETGLSSGVCSFGWIEINPTNGAIIKWVKKADVPK